MFRDKIAEAAVFLLVLVFIAGTALRVFHWIFG